MSKFTTSQTIGPFPHAAWQWAADLTAADRLQTSAATITVSGIVYDGDGVPVTDAQIEAWQPSAADAEQAQALPGFRRVPSGEQGEFSLRLSDVARAPGEPASYVTVFARGLVKHQFSAIFLEDDASLPQSAILEQVPSGRRATLLARRIGQGEYRWDIHLQGEHETAFFDFE